ncbi:MAG: PA14 domain-containing protein, partial [Anaerolineae bacterium]|nr:PA14 domain-containing protein [Anaerolineae bacterium]
GLYSHASFRIVPVLVAMLLAGEAWSSWRGQRRPARQNLFPLRGLVASWGVFLASAVVVTLPLVSVVLREPHVAFGERFTSVMPAVFEPAGAMQQDGLIGRAQRLLGFFNYRGESWGAVNLPDWPMLDPVTAVLFMLGFGCCLVYFWRNRHLFYLAWCLLTIIAGGLLTVDLRSHRFAGVMPVLFILAGLFLDGTMKTFELAFGGDRRRYLALFVVPVLAAAGWTNYYIFFQRQIHANSVRVEFTREVSDVANYIAGLGEGHYVYLFANYPYYSPGMDFAWMAGEAPGERGMDALDAIPSHGHTGDEHLVYIFVTPYNVEALAEVVGYFYPEKRIETFHGDYRRYTFVAAHVGVAEARSAQGLLAYYYSGAGLDALPEVVRWESQVSVDWRTVPPPLQAPFSVQWRGTLYAPRDGDYVLEMEPAELCRTHLDEVELASGEGVRLVKGWHKLLVACSELEDRERLRFLWTAPGRPREVVPSEFLSPKREVNGALVSVFEGPDWRGEPLEQSIQPVLSLLRMPLAWQSGFTPELAGKLYSLDCRGRLEVEQPGYYRFDLRAWNGHAALWIDGTEVVATEGAGASSGSGQVELASGGHDLWLRYSYQGGELSGVDVLWTPPDGETQTIPPALLRPVGELITGSASPAP